MRLSPTPFLGVLLALSLFALPSLAGAHFQPLELEEAIALLDELGGLEEYPNANVIVGLDRTFVEFDETGAYEEYNHTFSKILTDEGLDDQGDVSFVYHRRYGSVEVIMARVIKKDGTEIVVDEDLITDGTPPQISALDIYETDFREKTVVFPNLEVGDGVEYLIRQEYEPLIDDHFNGFYLLQYTEPILEASVSVSGPADTPLKHVIKDGEVLFTETTEGRRTIYTWTATNVPEIEQELGMVSLAKVATRVLVSTMHTWEEVSRYGWGMTSEKCVAEKSVRDLVVDITEGLTTTDEKIRAIHYWILENVRYLGIAMDRGMFLEPHFASYTLEREYGVCRDKAVLMVTMLGEIGVPAWVVFISPNRGTDPEIPNVLFEHGIVAIKGEGGEYRYIDPTMETSREVYSPYVGDRWVLVATEEGDDIRKVSHIAAAANSGQVTERSRLADDGSVSGSVTITGRGMYEEILRTVAKRAGEEQIRMMAEEMIHGLYPGATLADFALSDCDDLYEPLTMDLAYEINDYALDAEPYRLFRVPAASGEFDLLSGFLFGSLVGLSEREYPAALGVTLGMEEDALVLIPEGYVVENFPDDVDFKKGAISLSMEYEYVPPEANDGKPAVRYRRIMRLDSFEISPEDYLALKEAVRLASRSARGEVILKREEN